MTKIEEIYKDDWYNSDGPRDLKAFKKALNHPQFKRINFSLDRWGEDIDGGYVSITIERPETEEETKKRYAKNQAASVAAKKAAETREKNMLERECKEYERLKKKFDK